MHPFYPYPSAISYWKLIHFRPSRTVLYKVLEVIFALHEKLIDFLTENNRVAKTSTCSSYKVEMVYSALCALALVIVKPWRLVKKPWLFHCGSWHYCPHFFIIAFSCHGCNARPEVGLVDSVAGPPNRYQQFSADKFLFLTLLRFVARVQSRCGFHKSSIFMSQGTIRFKTYSYASIHEDSASFRLSICVELIFELFYLPLGRKWDVIVPTILTVQWIKLHLTMRLIPAKFAMNRLQL